MDTTNTPPPTEAPSAPASHHEPSRSLLRPLADVLDLVVLFHVAVVGAIVPAAFAPDDSGLWDAPTGPFVVGVYAAMIIGFLAWVALLVSVWRRHPTPGERMLQLTPTGRPFGTVARHVALVVAYWGTGMARVGLVEPPPTGPVGSELGAAIAVGAIVLAYGWEAWQVRRSGGRPGHP